MIRSVVLLGVLLIAITFQEYQDEPGTACAKNEEERCVRVCSATCKHPSRYCKEVPGCPRKVCSCSDGFVRNGENMCVSKKDCNSYMDGGNAPLSDATADAASASMADRVRKPVRPVPPPTRPLASQAATFGIIASGVGAIVCAFAGCPTPTPTTTQAPTPAPTPAPPQVVYVPVPGYIPGNYPGTYVPSSYPGTYVPAPAPAPYPPTYPAYPAYQPPAYQPPAYQPPASNPSYPAYAPACRPYEVYTNCGSPCEPSCADRQPSCAATCIANSCQCSRGYFRQNGQCISAYYCPAPTPKFYTSYLPAYQPYHGMYTTPKQCGSTEQYMNCMPCERACNTNQFLCYEHCVDGCACNQQAGYVRDSARGICVLPGQCSAAPYSYPPTYNSPRHRSPMKNHDEKKRS